jgi:hypothetical protein
MPPAVVVNGQAHQAQRSAPPARDAPRPWVGRGPGGAQGATDPALLMSSTDRPALGHDDPAGAPGQRAAPRDAALARPIDRFQEGEVTAMTVVRVRGVLRSCHRLGDPLLGQFGPGHRRLLGCTVRTETAGRLQPHTLDPGRHSRPHRGQPPAPRRRWLLSASHDTRTGRCPRRVLSWDGGLTRKRGRSPKICVYFIIISW